MSCRERMEYYLRDHGVIFESMVHRTSYTTAEMAAEMHVPGRQVAKVVMVEADNRLVMMVLPSTARLRLARVREVLNVRDARLAKEAEFAERFPDCAVGAMPPFGNLYDVQTYVDQSLSEQQEIVFRVGSHRQSIRISWEDYERLVRPRMIDMIAHEDSKRPPGGLRRAA